LSALSINARHYLFVFRGLTLLSRFLLITFLANRLSVVEVGFYGFVTALIFSTVFLVGLEYGNYSARKIIECRTFLCKQKTVVGVTIFGLTMFLIFSPLSYYFLGSNQISGLVSIFSFFVIVYGESYLAEHKKLLISLKHPIYSGVIDFIKTGFWVYLLILFVVMNWFELNLRLILFMWAFFVILGSGLVFIKLKSYYNKNIFFSLPPFSTYKQQISSSLPFFLIGFSMLLIEISGRFSLQMVNFQIEAGVYTFYSGFIFAIPLFVWSSSIAFDHAKIIESYEKGDAVKSDDLVMIMLKRSLMICASLAFILFIGFSMFLEIIDKEEYKNYINQFYIFLIVPFIHVIDGHLYYKLYVRKKEILITLSSVLGIVSLVIFQFLTIDKLGITSVIYSIILALTISVFLKIMFIRQGKYDDLAFRNI